MFMIESVSHVKITIITLGSLYSPEKKGRVNIINIES